MIIGLHGPAGSGKDTAADYICKYWPCVKYSFAAPIKAALRVMMPWTSLCWENRALKEIPLAGIGVSPRRMMQTLGTEWGRQLIHPDLWLMIAKENYAHCMDVGECGGMVISDVRFENEADWVRKNGVLVHIRRESMERIKESAHLSESGLPFMEGDRIISNDKAISDLYLDLDVLMAGISFGGNHGGGKRAGDVALS